jgi:hypothetical protein
MRPSGERHLPTSRRGIGWNPRAFTQEADMDQGNKKLGVGMVLGLAVGMILYRLLFG